MKDNDYLTRSSRSSMSNSPSVVDLKVDPARRKFPFCIVWTPIPGLTYLFPFIGHMGIATSTGIIRDFAGSYHVSEDRMAFGQPTKYWQLDYNHVRGGQDGWDSGVAEASAIYQTRTHNLCCDNCHSHVATALNIMNYKSSSNWNMVKLAFFMLIHGKYVSFWSFLKTWLPFLIIVGLIVLYCVFP
ncbi:transmembrane protein 222 [Venturia canescens]|uniref:transmembrane protein 222 n=1 Tax=Venturia canescens TaxID=32260 RepID=UPI001C9C5560|nr:transmembrane protein 222 [Venturia canescens]